MLTGGLSLNDSSEVANDTGNLQEDEEKNKLILLNNKKKSTFYSSSQSLLADDKGKSETPQNEVVTAPFFAVTRDNSKNLIKNL